MLFIAGLLVSLLMAVPQPSVSTSTAIFELGTRIAIETPGRITAIRFWRLPDDVGPHVGHVWSATGQEIAQVKFVSETASGWQEQALSSPLSVFAGSVTVSVNSTGHFAIMANGLDAAFSNGPLSSPIQGGRYGPSGAHPASASSNDYYRDIVFEPSAIGTIAIAPDGAGFAATLDGFDPGPYTLSVTLRSSAGVVTTGAVQMTMPIAAAKGAPE